MAGESIRKLKWTHLFVAIFKCYRRRDEPKEDLIVEELKVAGGSEIEADSNLRRVLRVLQRDLVEKRLYRYANNPTSRLLTFRSYPDGEENAGQAHLDALLQAGDKQTIRHQALALAERYKGISGVREGILIFLVSRGTLDQAVDGNCVFVFKCNFEAISQISPDELFRRIEDAIVEQTKKGALYPYFDLGRFDDNTIRVFDELGETQYWLEFLDLGERVSEHVPLQEVMMEQLPRAILEKYADEFAAIPSVRSLVDEDRLIRREDRLPTPEVKILAQAVAEKSGDQSVSLRLGELRFTAPLSQYGHTWILAEGEGERYILAKGSNLESRTKMLTPMDVSALPTLTEAAAELDIALS